MAKTYLELVNQVLKRVREDQVGTISANLYSVLISTFINDAKRVVEDSWEWSSLRKQVGFDLVASTTSYDLGSSSVVGLGNTLNERAQLLKIPGTDYPQAYDVTPGNQTSLFEVNEADVNYETAFLPSGTTYSTPSHFSLTPSADSLICRLYEPPSGIRNWRMFFKRPQDELSLATDTIKVPWYPVVLLATNYALNERGEEIGEPGNEAEKKYMVALSDAIALDSKYSSDSMVFRVD